MTPQELSRRFEDQVKMRAYKDKYVDENEERQILEGAINSGIGFDAARMALIRVCETHDYVLESVVLEKLKEVVETFAGNDGKIDEKEFNDTVTIGLKATKGKKNDREVKKMVIQMLEKDGAKVKTGFFSNWFKRVKSELGMA